MIGVPSFVVTLAGLLIWQGVILSARASGVIIIQDNWINNAATYYFSGRRRAGSSPRSSPGSTPSAR